MSKTFPKRSKIKAHFKMNLTRHHRNFITRTKKDTHMHTCKHLHISILSCITKILIPAFL